MPPTPSPRQWVTLSDGRAMQLRLATAAEASAIAAEHPMPHVPSVSVTLYRRYYEFKALLYVRAPCAGILTGWVGDKLAAFVFFCEDMASLKRSAVSLGGLAWLLKETATGRFGYGPSFWLEIARCGLQHLRQPRDYRSQAERRGEVPPSIASWIGTVHTVGEFRRLGAASCLLEQVEGCLRARGAGEVALWAADSNEPALRLYEKRGYEAIVTVGRLGEHCILMLKGLEPDGPARPGDTSRCRLL